MPSQSLFRDCALRVMQASEAIGIRGMLAHAISNEAKAFYLALGLSESPLEPMTLMVTLADLPPSRSGEEAFRYLAPTQVPKMCLLFSN